MIYLDLLSFPRSLHLTGVIAEAPFRAGMSSVPLQVKTTPTDKILMTPYTFNIFILDTYPLLNKLITDLLRLAPDSGAILLPGHPE